MNEETQTHESGKAAAAMVVTRNTPATLAEERDRRWEERLGQLAAFKAQHGHLRVARESAGFQGLAHWRDDQRAYWRSGTLPPERKARLDALGFEWESPSMPDLRLRADNQAQWEMRFLQLQAFREAHGHCQVSSKRAEYRSLGKWVGAQRQLHAHGKLLEERRARLEEIGFKWTYENLKEAGQWERRLAELAAFKEKHGYLKVSRSNQTSPGLAHWRDDQRLKQREGRLSPERKARLEALGFEWESAGVPRARRASDLPKDSISLWEYFFARLVAFHAQHGHPHVPASWPEDRALSAWVREQRSGYGYGRLHFDQIYRLEKLGFAWKDPPRLVVVSSAGAGGTGAAV